MTFEHPNTIPPQPKTYRWTLAIAWIASPLAIVGVAAAAIAIWELNASEDSSLVADIYQSKGWGEAAQLAAVREAEAAHANRMAAAEESEKRLTMAYQKIFDTYSQSYAALGDVARRAADLELRVGEMKAREQYESNGLRRLGVMGGDALCGLEMLSGGSGDFDGACNAASQWREDLMGSYEVIGRSDYASDVLSQFPDPMELIGELERERARVASEFGLAEDGGQ
ncbi:MAG: hypothetical protein AAFN91_10285 [Pseudomonadota bacterium]